MIRLVFYADANGHTKTVLVSDLGYEIPFASAPKLTARKQAAESGWLTSSQVLGAYMSW